MNKWDILLLAVLFVAMAYAASTYYPEEFLAFVSNDTVRVFSIILAAAAFMIFILDFFLKVFSKAAEKP